MGLYYDYREESGSDSGHETDKKEQRGRNKGFRVKVRNFPFFKEDQVNTARRLGGGAESDTLPYKAFLGFTSYKKDAMPIVVSLIPDTGRTTSLIPVYVAKANELSFVLFLQILRNLNTQLFWK